MSFEPDESFELIDQSQAISQSKTVTLDELLIQSQIHRVLDHHLLFNGSYKSLEHMTEIINATPNSLTNIPQTKYRIQQYVAPIIQSEYQIKCKYCKNYTSSLTNNAVCVSCHKEIKTSTCEYFINIPVKQQLMKSIESNFESVIAFNRARKSHPNIISDIHDADIYQTVSKRYPRSIMLPLILNSDGANVFQGSQKSLWMIQAYEGFLPPSVRYKTSEIMICSVYFGLKEPNMNEFFRPLLEEVRRIHDENGITLAWKNETFNFVPIIMSCSCDLPAKADIQGMRGHSAYFGCGYCEHPGVLIKSEKTKSQVVRYTNIVVKINIQFEVMMI